MVWTHSKTWVDCNSIDLIKIINFFNYVIFWNDIIFILKKID
jgi:hypothetical protein